MTPFFVRQRSVQFGPILGWAVGLTFVVLIAALLPVFPKGIIALALGVVAMVCVWLLSPYAAVVLLALVTFALIGPIESLGRVDRVFWASYLLALALWLKVVAHALSSRIFASRPRHHTIESNRQYSILAVYFVILLSAALFATLSAAPSPLQVVLATRDYAWMWSVFALVVVGALNTKPLVRSFHMLPWLVVLQTPLILYQRYAVSKGSLRNWDAVVGIFGGNPDGGGASGAMGAFSVLMALYTIVRARSGQVSGWFAALVTLSAAVAIGLAEVKFVVLTAPIVAIAVLGFGVIARSPKALLTFVLVLAAAPLALYGYWKSFETAGSKGYGSFENYMHVVIERNLSSTDVHFGAVEMGRVAAIKFWWEQADFSSRPVEALVGHGIGSTRIGIFPGDVAKRYTFKVARSSLVILLWELGLVGAIVAVVALVALLMRGTSAYKRLTTNQDADADLVAALRLALGVMVIGLLFLPYNTDLMGTPQSQLLFVMSCAVIWKARAVSHGIEQADAYVKGTGR